MRARLLESREPRANAGARRASARNIVLRLVRFTRCCVRSLPLQDAAQTAASGAQLSRCYFLFD
jgi:hypothetical protein